MSDGGTITLENGATLLDSSADYANTGSIFGAGTIDTGPSDSDGTLVGTGQIEANGGEMVIAAASVALMVTLPVELVAVAASTTAVTSSSM